MLESDDLGLFDGQVDLDYDELEIEKGKVKSDAISLFDHLKNLTENKIPWNEDDDVMKNYNQYMINKFISMDDRFVMLWSTLNQMHNLPDKTHYEFLFKYLPKQKIFFSYINNKHKKAEMDKIKIVAAYYRVSITEAEDIISMIPNSILEELYELYNTSEEINNG